MWFGGELREEPGLALPREEKEAEEGFAQHLPAPQHVPRTAHAAARPSTHTHSYKINLILLCSGPLAFPIRGVRSYSARKCLLIEAESSCFHQFGGRGNIF